MTAAALIGTVRIFFSVFSMILIVRMLLGFFPLEEDHPLNRWMILLTEPYLAPLRAFLEKHFSVAGFLDFSYLAAILLANLVETALIVLIQVLL